MEQIPTRAAPLVRQSPIASHNAVADCAFRLTLQCAFHIPFECRQCVDDTAVEDGDGAKACAKPGLPFLLVDCDSMRAGARGNDGGSVRRIDMVASSMAYEVVIS